MSESKVIVYIAVSLDWYIARPDGAVDWLDKYSDVDYGYNEFVESIDCSILGYHTYEVSLGFGADVFKDRKHYVFSRRERIKTHDNVEFLSGAIDDHVRHIKSKSHKNLWLMGGGNLIKSFLALSLVDEFIIFVMPEFLGSGIPLFPDVNVPATLSLKESEVYKNGVIKLHYAFASK